MSRSELDGAIPRAGLVELHLLDKIETAKKEKDMATDRSEFATTEEWLEALEDEEDQPRVETQGNAPDDQPAEGAPPWPADWLPDAWQQAPHPAEAWRELTDKQRAAASLIGQGMLEVSTDLLSEAVERFGDEVRPLSVAEAGGLEKRVNADARFSPELREAVHARAERAEAFPEENTVRDRLELALLKSRTDAAIEQAVALALPSGGSQTFTRLVDGELRVETWELDVRGNRRELLLSSPLEQIRQQVESGDEDREEFGDPDQVTVRELAEMDESRRRAFLERFPARYDELLRLT